MSRDLLRPIGVEETLLAFRLRYQPAPVIRPEDWSVLDLLLLPKAEVPNPKLQTPEKIQAPNFKAEDAA